jgi:hypothetical protein
MGFLRSSSCSKHITCEAPGLQVPYSWLLAGPVGGLEEDALDGLCQTVQLPGLRKYTWNTIRKYLRLKSYPLKFIARTASLFLQAPPIQVRFLWGMQTNGFRFRVVSHTYYLRTEPEFLNL